MSLRFCQAIYTSAREKKGVYDTDKESSGIHMAVVLVFIEEVTLLGSVYPNIIQFYMSKYKRDDGLTVVSLTAMLASLQITASQKNWVGHTHSHVIY